MPLVGVDPCRHQGAHLDGFYLRIPSKSQGKDGPILLVNVSTKNVRKVDTITYGTLKGRGFSSNLFSVFWQKAKKKKKSKRLAHSDAITVAMAGLATLQLNGFSFRNNTFSSSHLDTTRAIRQRAEDSARRIPPPKKKNNNK